MRSLLVPLIAAVSGLALAEFAIEENIGALPYFLILKDGNRTVVYNDGALAGDTNVTAAPLAVDGTGAISSFGVSGIIRSKMVTPSIARIDVNTSSPVTGAKFAIASDEKIFGIWSYPWGGSLLNKNISFDLKGIGNSEGINWCNARAPFFMSDHGYGIYVDSLAMGSYDLTSTDHVQFTFNTSSISYYAILPQGSPNNFKSILAQYMALSSKIEMPPDSAYGPTFWNDDFEQDFHGNVSNAEENIFDVVTHLQNSQIHASAIFDDRPYGTGNQSWGNFDFDSKFYPYPESLIQRLTEWGYDFQVWAANRAFFGTEMDKIGSQNGWLWTRERGHEVDSNSYLGPAFDLSVPEAAAWLKDKLRYFTKLGVKGFKIDRGEEEEMPVWVQNDQSDRFVKLLNQIMTEKWGKGNFYNFARSVVDRGRTETGVWNGDAHADWTGLKYSVASGIRAGLLGFSMWGSDTGGYNRNKKYQLTDELWARWMWFSTFSPVYEILVGLGHTPWYSPHANTTILDSGMTLMDVLKDSTSMHHELRPYILSHTHQAVKTGIPLIRALLLQAPAERAIHETSDAYFFGDEFFVAPVVTQGGTRQIRLPQGANYVNYFNKTQVFRGGSILDVAVSINRIPAFVIAGSIIPRGDTYKGNNNWTPNWQPRLTIEFFPSYDAATSDFVYWNGKNEEMITLTMYKQDLAASIVYGNVGIGGEIVVYTRNGTIRADIIPGGGTLYIPNLLTLFEDVSMPMQLGPETSPLKIQI